jgi:hypothetical protein
VVSGLRLSEAGGPNGPPSPRLAPGGFYYVSRAGTPVCQQGPYGVAAASGNRSWIGWTESGSLRIPSMARTQASAAGSVVMQGTP